MNLDALLIELEARTAGDPHKRLLAELRYARRVSLEEGGKHDALLHSVMEEALARLALQQVLTGADVTALEAQLSPMQADCKQYTWLFVGHAHIDMNWMWPFHETVSVTLNTFRTVLRLMEVHPGFTFGQSQASTYAIVEAYDPAMLEEIKQRIREGRWEVTASQWVEPDHNMLSLESEIRHTLYTKAYIANLLEVPPETLNLTFVPDTFGHNSRLPDVLSAAGVRYFYHCRGEEETGLYRWQGQAGELLAYCEPEWYCGGEIYPTAPMRIPGFCKKHHMPCMLTVFGVGDHGGGPTNRDLYGIEDWMTWSIFPTVRYGSYREFFRAAEKAREGLPVKTGERNSIFSGCYTTQTRIKRGNTMAERLLYKSELFSAVAQKTVGAAYPGTGYEKAWRKVLFNHFHDIIPGSGTVDTREYAMGEYQKVFAAASSYRARAYAALAEQLDTSSITTDLPRDDRSVGGGVGFGVGDYCLEAVSRGGGATRIFHLFNALPQAYTGNVRLIVWDYRESPEGIEVRDDAGHPLPYQLLSAGHDGYWGHDFIRLLVQAQVPACGYTTVVLGKNLNPPVVALPESGPRVDGSFSMVLENAYIRVTFDPLTGRVVRFLDKETNTSRFTDGGFDLVAEGTTEDYPAWRVGRYMQVENAGTHAQIVRDAWGALRQSYRVTVKVTPATKLEYTVSLDADSRTIVYDILCDWHEKGDDDRMPQLRYAAALPAPQEAFVYRNAGGEILRPSANQDMASLGGIGSGDTLLLCDGRYGFRGDGKTVSVTLIRASTAPDALPEMGEIRCRLALGLAGGRTLTRNVETFCQPVDCISGTTHGGSLPMTHSFFSLAEGDVEISGVKLAEADGALLFHIANRQPCPQTAVLRFDRPVTLTPADLLEHPTGSPTVPAALQTLSLPPHAVLSYIVQGR